MAISPTAIMGMAAMQQPVAAPGQAPEGKENGKKKGGGPPPWAGGPGTATERPPGLQGKDLPEGHPWAEVGQEEEGPAGQGQYAQQPQAGGNVPPEVMQLMAMMLAAMQQPQQPVRPGDPVNPAVGSQLSLVA